MSLSSLLDGVDVYSPTGDGSIPENGLAHLSDPDEGSVQLPVPVLGWFREVPVRLVVQVPAWFLEVTGSSGAGSGLVLGGSGCGVPGWFRDSANA